MKRRLSLLLLAAAVSFAGACSSDPHDSTTDPKGTSGAAGSTGPSGTTDPAVLCNELATAICSKLYSCYTAEQLVSMTQIAAHDQAGCVTQWATNLDCATDPTDCEAGQTYDSGKGQQCVNDYKAFTCAEFMGFLKGTTPTPTVCKEACK